MLPKNLKYGNKVNASLARSYTSNIQPNGALGGYTPNSVATINIPTGPNLALIASESILKFTITNTMREMLGGSLVEHVNETANVDKAITVNKGTGLLGINKNIKNNQTDIRSATDAVSFLSTTQNGDKYITIPDSFVVRPLRSHGAYNLKKFDKKSRF